jgi:hypothetical protein
VTNQVVNTFLELGLPFILRFVDDWRSGKASLKDIHKMIQNEGDDTTALGGDEKKFLDKVERELGLPDYSLFSQSVSIQ